MRKQSWIVVLMILIVSGLFAGDAVNFSGVWVLDESKVADDGGMPRMSATKIVVTQEDNNLSTERSMSNPMMGDFTVSETVTLDGKECKSETEFGSRVSTADFSEDKSELTINSTLFMNWDGQDMEMKSSEKWSLDKGALKIETTRDTPMGEMENVNYYNKATE